MEDDLIMYKKMYALVCASISEALDSLHEREYANAEMVLLRAQQQAEDMYILWQEKHP